MSRLHEYQSKALLRAAGIPTPRGGAVETPGEAHAMATGLGGPVVVKAQVWLTGRAGKGLVRFADTPDAAAEAARGMLGARAGAYAVERVMVEERLAIAREFYLGLIVDDRARAPVLILSAAGGTGIEDMARADPSRIARQEVDVRNGLRDFEARDLCRRAGLGGKLMMALSSVILNFYGLARSVEARTAEINPLALVGDDRLIALDARFTIDDNAVFRHPELGIAIAREFDRPPTALERIAWEIEKGDYRGTFYFVELDAEPGPGERAVGFHGNGGGGAMISMDALLAHGLRPVDFVDTSGNPPASKVYRAARLILSQPGLVGYFLSGSGYASQEQYHTARGLSKAFLELRLAIPAVIRLGGNREEQAIAILKRAAAALPAPVEGYGRDTPTDACAARLRDLIDAAPPAGAAPSAPRPLLVDETPAEPYRFETITGGEITYDHARCRACESKICIETCDPKILSLEGGVPVLNISKEQARSGGCTECLACEIECYFLGNRGGRIRLPIPGLESVSTVRSAAHETKGA
ncbi:MAG: acetate--CoA ligase family protein [Anaerolineae bacterium]|nr:acetate--CoA ligase family protein [Anaerolineae bacterium]